MADPEHLSILKQGREVWNKWREKHTTIHPDLSGADISRQLFLSKVNLSDSDLTDADLTGTGLFEAGFWRTNLTRAKLHRAILGGARFTDADLTGADLTAADLEYTDFLRANLTETDFGGALLGSTTFADVDLSSAKGLAVVSHSAPSTLGIDTLYRSKGRIPGIFLHGCGVPQGFIEYNRLLQEYPTEFYSCFISYSTRDKRFCNRLYSDLQRNAIRAWYFPEDAKWSEPVWGEIDRSIKAYDKLVMVCSKYSLQSGPVLRELERVLNREDHDKKSILFPIMIDNYIFNEWEHPRKADVLSKVVGDFRGWNRSESKYTVAFKKLLQALRTGELPQRPTDFGEIESFTWWVLRFGDDKSKPGS